MSMGEKREKEKKSFRDETVVAPARTHRGHKFEI